MRKLFSIALVLTILMSFSAATELEILLQDGAVTLDNLGKYKRALALDIARQLKQYRGLELLNERAPSHDLVPFLSQVGTTRDDKDFIAGVARLDREIREIKGIADRLNYILEIRLAFPERSLGEDVLVAYVPSGNERSWKYIEAFDSEGNAHQLDVDKAPEGQVIVVGLNATNDMRAGLALLNEELQKADMQISVPPSRGLQVAKLEYIRLDDDKEPWLIGDAEIYTLVNGIAPEASRANVLAVEMPYLEEDGKDYTPKQVLIVWDNYRYKAANLNIYEHDDSTNYKEIAAMMIEKIGSVVPEYKFIFDIASQIIRLMPDSWFVNDDDYVDVFYTLEMGKTYTRYKGASNNATITLVPYTIDE